MLIIYLLFRSFLSLSAPQKLVVGHEGIGSPFCINSLLQGTSSSLFYIVGYHVIPKLSPFLNRQIATSKKCDLVKVLFAFVPSMSVTFKHCGRFWFISVAYKALGQVPLIYPYFEFTFLSSSSLQV